MKIQNYILGGIMTIASGCAATSTLEDDQASSESALVTPSIAEKDLALIFTVGTTQLLRDEWYKAVLQGFRGSEAEDALETNNTREEWRNVSARVEPCAPLGVAPFQGADSLCWPEVRLVMQPVKARINLNEGSSPAEVVSDYADDRGIHLLYDVPGTNILTPAELTEANRLKARVTAAVVAGTWTPTSGEPLNAAEKLRFIALRNRVASALLTATVALRGQRVPVAAYKGFGPRPELATAVDRSAFATAYVAFLGNYARGESLKQLAAFSLQKLRSTVPDWRGAFLSLRPVNGVLVSEAVGVRSPATGKELIRVPSKAPNLTIQAQGRFAAPIDSQLDTGVPFFGESASDFPNLPELLGLTFAARTETFLPEARGLVVPPSIGSPTFKSIVERISDRTKVLVPNSSCATCHLLQQDNVLKPGGDDADSSNVHNLSFFQSSNFAATDRGFSVSPRVVKDVAFDLAWIRTKL
jgi:hypothetical protein